MKYRIAALLLSFAIVASGANFIGEQSYSLPAGETRIGDLYFVGTMLRCEGRLDGSLVTAAQAVNVSGPVTRNIFAAAQTIDFSGVCGQDVVAAGGTVTISGRVGGAARVAGSTVYVSGAIAEDLLAGCASLTVGKDAEIRGDVVAGCRSLNIAGTVRGGVRAVASEIVISGAVDGDVEVTVGERLTLSPDARIYGNLRYRSERKLDIPNADLVFGSVEHLPVPAAAEIKEIRQLKPRPGVLLTFFLPLTILSIVGALVTGLLLVAIWKHALNEALNRSLDRWGRTLGFGAIGFLIGPMTIIVGLALIVTIPAALVALAGYISCLYLAKILAGMLLGRLLFRIFRAPDASLWAAAPVGIVIVWVVAAIPYVGWVVWLAALGAGFGIIAELLGMSRQQ